MPKNQNKYLIIFLFILLITAKGCGIFDTRAPEAPVNIRSTFVPPTSPALVITNLQYAISEKNSVNYSKCLNQANYLYVPDSKSQQIYGQIFQGWNTAKEKTYFDNLISQTNESATSTLFLDNERTTYITPDSVSYKADYIIVFQHNRNNIPKSATGSLRFILNSDVNNLFSITSWEDYRQNDTTFTWSELKANFSN